MLKTATGKHYATNFNGADVITKDETDKEATLPPRQLGR
jgi:hypothetical protein